MAHFPNYEIKLFSPSNNCPDMGKEHLWYIQIIKDSGGMQDCHHFYSKTKKSALYRINIIVKFIRLMCEDVEVIIKDEIIKPTQKETL